MFQALLERIALALEAQDIAYMVIGGQAVLLYGEPRLTRDIDVALGVSLERLPEVLQVAQEIGLEPLVQDPEAFVRQTMVLPCADPSTEIRVDFILSFSPYERQALQRVRTVPLGRVKVRFIAPEDLVIHKVIAGRPRDLEDVRSVLLKNPGIEVGYIRRWLREFEQSLGEPLQKRFEEILEESR